MKYLVVVLFLLGPAAHAAPEEVDPFHWTGVERVVAVGDLHGDYGQYLATLQAAGVVNARGKWSGGATHLVQTGDIPDRGPDTLEIIEHMSGLDKEARRKGGRVHNLMGNHEAMNVYGDLRYVTEGEFAAFAGRGSADLRDRYYDLWLQDLQQRDPERFAALPDGFRAEWDSQHPLGWVEHRQSWDPRWNPEGAMAEWALARKVAIRINDSVFLHGGISGHYCQNSLESLTTMAHAALANFNPAEPGIVEDEFGPLWFRGMAGEAPEAPRETVDAVLAQQGASRIVIGHTPTSGVIWPRYDARVIQIDTGISGAYGGYIGWLELGPDGPIAGYPGGRLELPSTDTDRIDYLQRVIALQPDNPHLKARLQQLQAPELPAVPVQPDAVESPEAAGAAATSADGAAEASVQPEPIPICGIRS